MGSMHAMMLLKHLQSHVGRSAASTIIYGNASCSKGLFGGAHVPAHSWKLYSSRSHTGLNGTVSVASQRGAHDCNPLMKFNIGSATSSNNARKVANKIWTPCDYKGTRGGLVVTDIRKQLTGERYFATMNGKGPGLIVFDLDYTLWPHHVDTTVNPPFIQKDSKVVDQDGVTITYYPEVPQVLEFLKSEGYSIGAASRTTKPPAAEQLLNFFDWNKYFKYKEIYPGSKVTHFAKFVEQTNIPHGEMLFFDDEQRNIIDMEKEGVKCVLVKNGVNLQLVKDSIEKFKSGTL